jgi:predicted membrane-bound spermidine synthase
VALLLFTSGACALIYQTAWLREFRLVFGASTAATSAVLAIFMGGLGLGGLILGPRVDRGRNPLLFYANLELFIAVTAAVTPLLVWLIRVVYVATGGSAVLGNIGATLVRVLLAALVLAVPTFLMGGTLPAAARAVEREGDLNRRELALIYGTNTVGAVVGTLLSTFVMLEFFGTRKTLWIAALVNVLIAMIARGMARQVPDDEEPAPPPERVSWRSRQGFVLLAAAAVGFAFLLMELVWYRMLAPLLGGSTFTFGLILALALLGIGLGGVAYSWTERREVTLLHLSLTCALEAFFVALPLAMGDSIAILALLLRPTGAAGFGGLLLSWAAVASLVVLPAAIIAGYQFPLLIGLLGKGRTDVGRDVGLGYLWNTVGAIAGALAGGFGLLPLLSAPGAWRFVVLLLLGIAAAAIILSIRQRSPRAAIATAVFAALIPLPMLFAEGPTAAWRHSGIGAGRAGRFDQSPNGLHDWANRYRRVTPWESEGIESSVAISTENGLSFIINGKNDGNARVDAGTQVMSGLLGALLQGSTKRALVVGLGTGSTSGWLASIPGIEEVHTVELERSVLHVARECAVVNRDVLSNPRMKLTIGDAREVLLTEPAKYDVIFSEPSNPYRAGIASLFTREFYRSAAARLNEGGIFVQWLQSYEVDPRTVVTVIGTLGTVFPDLEIWQSKPGDLLLIGSFKPRQYDLRVLRQRMASEPFRSALFNAWRVRDVEGLLAHFIAGGDIGQRATRSSQFTLNTDDRNVVEFGFARSVGSPNLFDVTALRDWARAHEVHRPRLSGGEVDWRRVEDRRLTLYLNDGVAPPLSLDAAPDLRKRHAAMTQYLGGNLAHTVTEWGSQPRPPQDPVELAMVADALADGGDARALPLIELLRSQQSCEADAILASYHLRTGNFKEAAASLVRAFMAYRRDPWPLPIVTRRMLFTASEIVVQDPASAAPIYEGMSKPFAAFMLDDDRRVGLVNIGMRMHQDRCNPKVIAALHQLEPHVPWQRDLLELRSGCYDRLLDPRAGRARDDLDEFLSNEPTRTLDLP